MEPTEKNKVVIDLAKSINSCYFEGIEIIHKAEFARVTDLIDNKIKHNETEHTNREVHNRYNDTITILGSRGSGKTSFMMSILHKYEKHDDIEVIELIDPTLIEEKGHIFLTLISMIQDKVDKAIDRNECDPYCKEYRLRKYWNDTLHKLAAGLPSIDINSDSLYSNWNDPEHIMNKGLLAVKAAKDLEANFNNLVMMALEILNKRAFLVAFDDIDVNFNNGWKVLETIRKYLTSPQIITLLSGDIKLFSKSIRKQQWINFGSELIKNEGERLNNMGKYDELVTEIEGQYMQKIMKAPNRIHLSTIGEMLNNKEVSVCINNEENDIYNHYTQVLKGWGIHNKYEAHSVVSYLLTLPLRTQIQLLNQFERINDTESNILNITDAFISDLYESGVDFELAKSQPNDFCYIAHDFLLKKELLNETYQLLPTSGSVNYNAVLFSLYTMFIAHSRNNPSIFFEYWISIATIKNLLTIMPYRSDQKRDTMLIPTIEGVSEYSFIGQNKVYRDICSYLSTYIRASLNYNNSSNKTPWGGTLILKGLAENAKRSHMETQDRIDSVFKDAPLMDKQLAFFPMSIASFAHKQQSIVIYSIYTLMGTIVELLKRYNVIKKNVHIKDDQIEKDIHVLLKELAQVKDNVMPVFEHTNDPAYKRQIYNTIEDDDKSEGDSMELAKALCAWMDRYPKCVPSHLIGKAATRAFYAIRNLDDRILDGVGQNLGDAMHRRIVIIMNSVLVEDAKENLENFTLSNNNPAEKDRLFIDNLKKINGASTDGTNLQFSRWLISCPLLLLYLKTPCSDISSYNDYRELPDLWANLDTFLRCSETHENCIGYPNSEWYMAKSIYDKLQQVSIYTNGTKVKISNKTSFSITNRNSLKNTIEILSQIYDTPKSYIRKNSEGIDTNITTHFKKGKNLINNINEVIDLCRGYATWDEILIKFESNDN